MPLISHDELVAGLPPHAPVSPADVDAARASAARRPVLVVLDDDPTGTQSVADLPVLTAWEEADFDWALATGSPAIYVMTNSRSLAPADAERVNREVVASALTSAKRLGIEVDFVSRSDSTLRGHFPLEPDTIAAALEENGERGVDGVVLVPAFPEAGRITLRGIHYAGSADAGYVPAAESEFAKDNTFGYSHSAMGEWVEEKTGGRTPAGRVLLIDIETLRTDPDRTVEILRSARDSQPIALDVVEASDLRALALALIRAEEAGSRFVYRVGPPFVRERIGQIAHEPLTSEEIAQSRSGRIPSAGGLVVVGSHVGVTARQLDRLTARSEAEVLVLDSARIITGDRAEEHIRELVEKATAALETNTIILRTSRAMLSGFDANTALAQARAISAAIVAVVHGIVERVTPRFVVAKGGITSSDVASKGLEIRRARVVGPMLPGIVSLWSSVDGIAAGVPYIVFAGNVGTDESLADVVEKLEK